MGMPTTHIQDRRPGRKALERAQREVGLLLSSQRPTEPRNRRAYSSDEDSMSAFSRSEWGGTEAEADTGGGRAKGGLDNVARRS